jgi:hypothetical protein
MTKNIFTSNFPFFLGSIIIFVLGLTAAFIPSIAYATIVTIYIPPAQPLVRFYPSELGLHMFTPNLMLVAIGGAIGLFSLTKKGRKLGYASFAAIAIAALGLVLPAIPNMDTRGFSEYLYFDMPFVAFWVVLAGVSVMFLALALKNPKVPRIALASVPLLLISYGFAPIMVLINYFPRFVFNGMFSMGSVLIGTLTLVGCLLMVWGAYKAAKTSTLPAKTG